MVCADPELSNLDYHLSIAFESALRLSQNPSDIRSKQRQWLRSVRNKCTDTTCLWTVYAKRLSELEEIVYSFTSTPSAEEEKVLCHLLADPNSRQQILAETKGAEDINNDGRPEQSKACSGGTMHVPCTQYFDSEGNEIYIQPVGFEWKDYWTYGVRTFRYRRKTYSLHAFDDYMKKPAYLSHVTPTNKEYVLCEFSNQELPVISFAERNYRSICEEVLNNQGSNLEYAVFDKPPNEPKPLAEDSWRRLEKSGLVDINNDGRKEWVAEISITSGAGRGCDANIYSLLNKEGVLSESVPEKHLLDEMQGEISDISCGRLSNRLLQIGGKVYFERNVGNNDYFQHALFLSSGSDVKKICSYQTIIRTSVKLATIRDRPEFRGWSP
jgi:hypothetical protein